MRYNELKRATNNLKPLLEEETQGTSIKENVERDIAGEGKRERVRLSSTLLFNSFDICDSENTIDRTFESSC